MVCVLEQGWNKTLQVCGPPGTEFDTPVLEVLYIFINKTIFVYISASVIFTLGQRVEVPEPLKQT